MPWRPVFPPCRGTRRAAGARGNFARSLGMARVWQVPLLLNAVVSAAAALPGADCAWTADNPSCVAMCDKTNIRAPDCEKTQSETCKWCSQIVVSGLTSDQERALLCRAHYYVDPWEEAQNVVDLRLCQYDTERELCSAVEGPEGRLKCQNPPPSPLPLPPASPPPAPPPPAPPPTFPPAAAAFDLNVFDIAAIIVAALLTIPLIRAAKESFVLRFNRAMVTPGGGQGPGDQEIEVADDLEGRASRDQRRAGRKQDKRKLLQPS